MASAFQREEAKPGHDIEKKDSDGRTLTYELLEEQTFNNSDIVISDYAPVLLVPANVKYEDSFVSLKKDAREHKIGPWRGEVKAGPKKLFYSFNVEDATNSGSVRVSKPKISVEYQVTENTAVGVAASSALHDKADAEAWGASVKDEQEAQVKYKLLF